ncbi:MAG: winged helix-turn-helix domain-containing protein [Alphaproteobacteria bacterium]|nr:winged helix-turn-helix domain-containing protein [Alphaproteobacteria bacterium]
MAVTAHTITNTKMSRPAARLAILGSFSMLGSSGQPLNISSKKNRALLGILALSPRQISSRERLASLLWGDHGEDQARASLRQSLATLRREIGPADLDVLRTSEDGVGLDLSLLHVDALEFLDAAQNQDTAPLARAAKLWSGPPLQDLALRTAAFEDWSRAETERLIAAASTVFERLSQTTQGRARIDYATRLVALDPLRETSQRELMRAYAGEGDNGLALKQYETCRKLLAEELGVDPALETTELRNQIATSSEIDRGSGSSPPSPPAAERPTIAVLPLLGASNIEGDEEFLADGITEDVIAALSRFRRLAVVSRGAAFSYRGRDMPVGQIGRELNAQFVLQGTVRQAGRRIRLTAELIDASTGLALWSDRLEHAQEDVFDVIDDLSGAIAVAVIGSIEVEVLRRSRRKSTSSFGAYELLVRGRSLLQRSSMAEKREARRLFEEAIQLDPIYAHAHVQLALSYLQEFFFDDSGAALERAHQIASEALLLDEEEPWCHMILGLTHLHRRNFDPAVKHCERAVALNPNDPSLLARLGLVLTDVGRATEAITVIERAMALSPHNPDKYNDYLSIALFTAGQYEAAAAVVETLPVSAFYTHVWLAAISIHLNDPDKAKAHRDRALELAPDFSVSRFARMEPIRDPADLARWTDALRAAGFPA